MSKIKELTKEVFDIYPVLAWSDDGEGYTPVVESFPLPDNLGPLLIKAKLFPDDGPVLQGYVIGLGSVYALGIFAAGTDYVFNRRMGTECEKVASELLVALGVEPFSLFPLRFATEFRFANGGTIEGSFTVD